MLNMRESWHFMEVKKRMTIFIYSWISCLGYVRALISCCSLVPLSTRNGYSRWRTLPLSLVFFFCFFCNFSLIKSKKCKRLRHINIKWNLRTSWKFATAKAVCTLTIKNLTFQRNEQLVIDFLLTCLFIRKKCFLWW